MNANTQQHDENRADGRSDSNGGLGRPPSERTHRKTEIWWLIERGSPVEYASDLSTRLGITNDPWMALKYPTKEIAEEMLGKSCYGGLKGWRILDHLFYV